MRAFVVVNPRAGNGRTAREWPEIEAAFKTVYEDMSVAITRGRGEATGYVRDALQEGYAEIIAVGGDGTINEAVTGFFDADGPIAPNAVFGFITSGTGGDFRRTFGLPSGWRATLAHLKNAGTRTIDIGRVSCLDVSGTPVVRHFINIASFGLSGAVVDSVNRARIAKLFGGRFAFAFHSALDMLTYRGRAVRLHIDTQFDEIVSVSTVAIANGQYFGGGMQVAPHALPDDGLFDVIVIESGPKGRDMAELKLLYTGEHLDRPYVRAIRGRTILAAPVAQTGGVPVPIEVDGESAGRLPATFEILPRALRLRC